MLNGQTFGHCPQLTFGFQDIQWQLAYVPTDLWHDLLPRYQHTRLDQPPFLVNQLSQKSESFEIANCDQIDSSMWE